VLVVDTCFTVDRTLVFRAAIEATTTKPPRTLVNTHTHCHHTHGNFLFRDATIIGHEQCREEVLRSSGLASTQALVEDEIPWGPIGIEAPSVTFRDRLTLHVGDLRMDAIHLGPDHTTNDVVYHLPAR
jgi:cyclase